MRRVTGQVLRSRALWWVGTGDKVRLWVVREGLQTFWDSGSRVVARGDGASAAVRRVWRGVWPRIPRD